MGFERVALLLEIVDCVSILRVLGTEIFELLVTAVKLSSDFFELLSKFDIIVFHFGILLVLGNIPKIHQILHFYLFTPNN